MKLITVYRVSVRLTIMFLYGSDVCMFVGPLQRVRPRNGILALVVVLVLPLRSEFIGEL